MKPRAIDILMDELVWYGGLLCTRDEVRRDVLKITGSDRAADAWAFCWAKKGQPEEITEEMPVWSQQVKKQEGL